MFFCLFSRLFTVSGGEHATEKTIYHVHEGPILTPPWSFARSIFPHTHTRIRTSTVHTQFAIGSARISQIV